jgi:hypothetical protein
VPTTQSLFWTLLLRFQNPTTRASTQQSAQASSAAAVDNHRTAVELLQQLHQLFQFSQRLRAVRGAVDDGFQWQVATAQV